MYGRSNVSLDREISEVVGPVLIRRCSAEQCESQCLGMQVVIGIEYDADHHAESAGIGAEEIWAN